MSLAPSYPHDIHPLVDRINAAAQRCKTTNGSLRFESDAVRRDLIAATEQLLLAARSPEENIFAIAQQVSGLPTRLLSYLFLFPYSANIFPN